MKIFVNGEILQTEITYLDSLLEELGYQGNWLATAVNSEVISLSERSKFALHEGDKIEILAPMQGG
ncbi:sulfur carrier protein ThiS [Bartonella ancashensis]|uniref:Sulfur carrier protein ThiS n=1 Tax=Bartonella ancashensis TaxID=1318743 RepID=A0A0M4LTN9_9HYPH|nr:sulfur carrier protein ThiS [Bartonella ancashensis]ALE04022.1 Sulfur carrier protein ThiS [Bartonella ancashensis]